MVAQNWNRRRLRARRALALSRIVFRSAISFPCCWISNSAALTGSIRREYPSLLSLELMTAFPNVIGNEVYRTGPLLTRMIEIQPGGCQWPDPEKVLKTSQTSF